MRELFALGLSRRLNLSPRLKFFLHPIVQLLNLSLQPLVFCVSELQSGV